MSFKREIELEDRLNKIASKAVREPSEEEFTNPFKSSVSKPKSTSKELTDMKDLRQLTIEAQLAKISTNAIQDKLGIKPSKIKSDVTKEMILDYQNEMLKPVEIGGVKYKYHPSSLDLDLEEYVPIHVDVLTQEERTGIYEQMNRLAEEIQGRLKPNLKRYEQENVDIKAEFDRRLGRIRSSTVLRLADKVRAIKNETDAFEAAIARNEAFQNDIKDRILDAEREIQGLQFATNVNYEKISENQKEERRVKNINAPRIKAYEEDLNLLNRGRLNVSQEPNESDEDYKERLRQTGQMTVSEDDMARSAELYNRDKLRELVLELVRDTGIISNAIKFLTEEQVFKINQNWRTIKRDFIKAYGFDNKSVKEEDLIDFFLQEVDPIIDAINKGKAPPPSTAEEEGVVEATASALPTFAQLNKLGRDKLVGYYQTTLKIDPKTDKTVYPRSQKDMLKKLISENLVADREVTGQPRGEPAPKGTILSSFSTEVKSPPLGSSLAKKTHTIDELRAIAEPVLNKLTTEWERITSTSADEDRRTLGGVILAKIGNAEDAFEEGDKDKFYRTLNELEELVPDIIRREQAMAEIYPREITGNGLQPIKHDIPNLIEFGKVKISPRKLYYNNTLVIKHKSGNSLVGLPNTQVSDNFVSIIMNLLKGKKPSLKDFNQLELSEKGIYDSLIYIAGLGKEVDNNFSETKQHLKNRLELIEGSIGAGNTNPALKKELHALLGKMAHTGMIGYGDAKRYYMSVCK